MVNVIGVRFPNAGKLYYFTPGPLWPSAGDYVVVETIHGLSLGEGVMPVHEMDETVLSAPLKVVTRIASQEDLQRDAENHQLEKKAEQVALQKIKEHKLPMKLVGTEYTFDRAKVIFYFTADGRVDFRALVRDLSGALRPRVELRQIGVRDEARMMGGLGPCGRPICCSSFLGDFQPVSIKMAKSQNLSMNPAKISGICGKLMCCIKFEEETYEQTLREMPPVNTRLNTPDGPGVVTNLYVVREMVRVRVNKGDAGELHDYTLAELRECNPQWKPARRGADPDGKPEKAEKSDRSAKPERPEQPENAEMPQPAADPPASAEAPSDQPQDEPRPPRRERHPRSRRPDRPEDEATAAAEPAGPSEPTRPVEAPSPAASWRDQLAQAMKAAGNNKETGV